MTNQTAFRVPELEHAARRETRRLTKERLDGGAVFDLRDTDTRVVAIRDDTRYVSQVLTPALASATGQPRARVAAIFAAHYAEFCETAHALLAECIFEGDDPVEVHVHCPDALASAVRQRARGLPIVSLDPMMGGGVTHLGVSRLYYLGGSKSAGATARPGWKSLPRQYEILAEMFADESVCLVDDDLYTGGTARSIIERIRCRVELFVPQILVAADGKEPELGVEVAPVIEYRVACHSRIEIADVRDFLVGASGLVVELPSGALGRAPYFHPFASPAARANIDPREEKRFSRAMLEANARFFAGLERDLGCPVTIGELPTAFASYAAEVLDMPRDTSVRALVDAMASSVEREWQRTEILGNVHEAAYDLRLPKRIVFVDVNGTLIPDESREPVLSEGDRSRLSKAAADLAAAGISVGLCSDSPLEPLWDLSRSLSFDGPILAENGLVLSFHGTIKRLRHLPDEEEIRRLISAAAPRELVRLPDCTAPEFGGPSLALESSAWAFGKDRRATLSVFGPSESIARMGAGLARHPGIDMDISPEFGFLGIYPLEDFRAGKALALSALSRLGFEIVMIGNSRSDWVPVESGVRCAFVSNAELDDEMRAGAFAISKGEHAEGVLELLYQLQNEAISSPKEDAACRRR